MTSPLSLALPRRGGGNSLTKTFLLPLSFFLLPSGSDAWWRNNHEAIVRIAYAQMSPAAQSRFRTILGEALDFGKVGSWADDIKKERPDTGPWHYISLPLGAKEGQAALDLACSGGNCVVGAIRAQDRILRDPRASDLQRKEALLFICHLVGDLAQPLHCADDRDRGGNDKRFKFKGKNTNLHALWDSGVTGEDPSTGSGPRGGKSGEALAADLVLKISRGRAAEWARGSLEDWAWEGHRVAVEVVYPDYQAGLVRGKAYSAKRRGLVEERLMKGGLRLALVLEKALRHGGQAP